MKLTVLEIAQRLSMNSETLERWIRQGKIPINQRGETGIFNENELMKWAEKQRLSYKVSAQEETGTTDPLDLVLLSAVKQGGVYSGIKGVEKEDIIRSAVDLVPDIEQTIADELYAQLIKREELSSTGIGKGVAIPHPRNPLTNGFNKPMIVTCFLENSVDFNAIDSLPVFVSFLLLSPSVEHHLNLLSRLSFCLRDNSFIAFLKQIPDADTFIAKIEMMEKNIEKKGI
jgi:PTS system nitrogen regulatory IIA component